MEPSKHEALTRCCFNIDPPPPHQRPWTNIETTLGQVLVFPERAVCVLIHACRLCLVGTGCTVLCVTPRHRIYSLVRPTGYGGFRFLIFKLYVVMYVMVSGQLPPGQTPPPPDTCPWTNAPPPPPWTYFKPPGHQPLGQLPPVLMPPGE